MTLLTDAARVAREWALFHDDQVTQARAERLDTDDAHDREHLHLEQLHHEFARDGAHALAAALLEAARGGLAAPDPTRDQVTRLVLDAAALLTGQASAAGRRAA